jgi:uncharacterized protein (DUF1778 family)
VTTLCRHNVYMGSSATTRKPLGVRATLEEHERILQAARRERRSVNSFVLGAALQAADAAAGAPRRRTPEEVQAAILKAQRLMRPYRQPGRSLVDELLAERRAEASRE